MLGVPNGRFRYTFLRVPVILGLRWVEPPEQVSEQGPVYYMYSYLAGDVLDRDAHVLAARRLVEKLYFPDHVRVACGLFVLHVHGNGTSGGELDKKAWIQAEARNLYPGEMADLP
jgi:hypothetical protein